MTEQPAKPVSAPSRISSRDDVWRDIRDWAKPTRRSEVDDDDDEGGGDNGRMIGSQVKDNVTEQRLLESRLLDLSKERYKFIVQVAWQRKAFMDKQKRKTSVMKDLLQNVDVAEASVSMNAQRSKNNRSKLTEKLDTYRDLVKKTYSEQRRLELEMQRKATGPEEMKPIIPGTFEPIYKTEPTFSARGKRRGPLRGDERGASRGGHGEAEANRRRTQNPTMFPAIKPPETSSTSRQQSVPPNFMRRGQLSRTSTRSRLPDPVMSNRSGTAPDGQSKVSVSAENLPRYLKYRSCYDGRFKRLERSLSASYDGKTGSSIESILNGLPSRSMSVAL